MNFQKYLFVLLLRLVKSKELWELETVMEVQQAVFKQLYPFFLGTLTLADAEKILQRHNTFNHVKEIRKRISLSDPKPQPELLLEDRHAVFRTNFEPVFYTEEDGAEPIQSNRWRHEDEE